MGANESDAIEPGVDAPRFVPLYRQIKALITRGLRDGTWLPGGAIPSEMELAARFNVSQGTVRKAIEELAAENLLVRRQGRGTFVATHDEPRTQFRFLRLRPDDGVEQGFVNRILECRRARAPVDIARSLALRSGEAVILIRRLLSLGETPTVLDEIWLPGRRFRGLTTERLAARGGPLYGMFEREFGTRMIGANERLKAVAAGREVARALQVAEGAPLLQVERVSFTYDNVPVEVRKGHYVTETHHYATEVG